MSPIDSLNELMAQIERSNNKLKASGIYHHPFGYPYMCFQCNVVIDDDPVYDGAGRTFCGTTCLDRHAKEAAKSEEQKAWERDQYKKLIRGRWV